jgi:hypothetical protein
LDVEGAGAAGSVAGGGRVRDGAEPESGSVGAGSGFGSRLARKNMPWRAAAIRALGDEVPPPQAKPTATAATTAAAARAGGHGGGGGGGIGKSRSVGKEVLFAAAQGDPTASGSGEGDGEDDAIVPDVWVTLASVVHLLDQGQVRWD